jgi:hypothetical protein
MASDDKIYNLKRSIREITDDTLKILDKLVTLKKLFHKISPSELKEIKSLDDELHEHELSKENYVYHIVTSMMTYRYRLSEETLKYFKNKYKTIEKYGLIIDHYYDPIHISDHDPEDCPTLGHCHLCSEFCIIEDTKFNNKLNLIVRKRDIEKKEVENLCSICLSNKINMVLRPCCHVCLCETCTEQINKCPLCNAEIQSKFKVFIA